MRWRPSHQPPRLAQLLIALATPPDERGVVLSDLQDEFEQHVDEWGTDFARRYYRGHVARSLPPAFYWRLERLRRHASGRRASFIWRPEPSIPTDAFNRRETMSELYRDLKFAGRSLSKSPLVLAVAVLSLGIGIGASTTVFSMANALLFRPPAVDLGDDVVEIFTSEGDDLYGETSHPDARDLVEGVDALGSASLFRLGALGLEHGETRARLMVELVAGDYFEIMGMSPTLGRFFDAAETPVGAAEPVVVLGYRLWTERFGADTGVLGQTVRLDGRPFTVIGIGPKGYLSRFLGLKVDAWAPLGVPGGIYKIRPGALADRGTREYRMLARLAPNATLAQARAQLSLFAEHLREEYPETWIDARGVPRRLTVLPEEEALVTGEMFTEISGAFGLMLALTVVILLIACSNAASIFLARARKRRREMAVRLAIGASRRRLVAMLLTESLLPALAAGALGLGIALAATRAMDSLPLPLGFPIAFDFAPDLRVFLFTLGMSLLASLFFGLFPALDGARSDLVTSLKADPGTGQRGAGRFGLRRFLVVAQIGAALVFVIVSAMVTRSLQEAQHLDTGLDVTRNAFMVRALPEDRFGPEAAASYLDRVLSDLRAMPEVEDAHLSRSAELTLFAFVYTTTVEAEGFDPGSVEAKVLSYNSVTPGYLEMMGIELLRGRALNVSDRAGSVPVAVVNEAFVEHHWPGADGLGRRFRMSERQDRDNMSDETPFFEVVGVVKNGHYSGFNTEDDPYFWTPLAQDPSYRVLVHARGRTDTAAALEALRERVVLEEGEMSLVAPTAYGDMMAFELFGQRLASRLFGWAGLFGLLLALGGIYGIVAFTVSLRRREMALRQVLGASPPQVRRLVLGDGLKLTLWGLAAGLVLTVPISLLIRDLLVEIEAVDPLAFGGSSLLVVAAALAAGAVPAWRASRSSPMRILRDE